MANHSFEKTVKMKDFATMRWPYLWMNAWYKGYFSIRYSKILYSLLLWFLVLPNIPCVVLATSCPGICNCDTNRHPGFTVECIHRRLSVLPSIPQHTVHLKLSDNSILHIRNYTLDKLSSLTTLYLDHNSISIIESGAFQYVPKLQVLSLRKNKISALDPHVFAHLHHLEILDLGENRIRVLYKEAFAYNKLLMSLSLDSNLLFSITNGSLHSLRNLEKLSLQNNHVNQLHPEVFYSQYNLIELNLSNMELETIPMDLFRNQHYLQVLDLAQNNMMTVLPKPFKHLSELLYLNISGNPLHCDCKLISLQSWLMDRSQKHLIWNPRNIPVCKSPEEVAELTLFEVPTENMTCSSQAAGITGSVVRKKVKPTAEDPNRSKLGPLVYDPLMGWYTASTLTGMLFLFLLCVALDKLKRMYFRWRRIKRKLKEQHQYEFCGDKKKLDGECISLKTFNRKVPTRRQSSKDSTKTHRSTQSAPIRQSSMDSQKVKLTHQSSFDSRLLRYPAPKQRQFSQDSQVSQSSQDSNRLFPLSLQHSQLIRQLSGESYWTGQSSQDSGSLTRQSSQESGPRPLSIHGQFIRAASFDARSRTPSIDHSAIPFRLGVHGHLERASSFDARAIMRQPSIEGGQVLKAYSQEAFRRQFSIDSQDGLLDRQPQTNLVPTSGLSQSHDSPLGKSQLFGPVFIKQKGSDSPLRRQSSSSQESTTPKAPIARPEILPVKSHLDGLPLTRNRPMSPLVRQESQGSQYKLPQSPLLQQTLKSPGLIKQRSQESPFLQVQARRSSLVRQRSHELPLHYRERPVSPLAQPPRDLAFPQSCHEELQIKTYPSGNTLTVSPLRHHMTPPTSPGVHNNPDFSTTNMLMVPSRPPSSPTPKRPSQDSLPCGMALHLPEIVIQVFDQSDSPTNAENT